ncbi:MAG: glycosyltransferase family 2 protein [Pseudomonadota bacterium]
MADPHILIITTMRNEGPFILEWLAHHRALGVGRFLIYANECDDGTDVLLERLHTADVLTYVPFTPKGRSVQWPVLRAARETGAYADAQWVLCIDCDEFVNLRAPLATLSDLIDTVPVADAFALGWRLFGSGGHLHFDPAPVTQRFQRAAPEVMLFPAASRFFKSLYRKDASLFARPGIHRPKRRSASKDLPVWVDGSGLGLGDGFAQADAQILLRPDQCGRDLVQLNHYSLRSAEDFLIKRRRGLPNRRDKDLDASYWAERNFNTVEDRSIDRHAAGTQAELARLMALPGISQAHGACITKHRAQIAKQLAKPAEARLFTRLSLLPDSIPPDEPTARAMLRIVSDAGR